MKKSNMRFHASAARAALSLAMHQSYQPPLGWFKRKHRFIY
jgi:hypothetical protein